MNFGRVLGMFHVNVLSPGVCYVSQGVYFATIQDMRNARCLKTKDGISWHLSDHQVHRIFQWARAHGYSKERQRVDTQANNPRRRAH